MIICVQGLGYVGSAMCVAISLAKKKFKSKKFKVIGVEQSTDRGKEIVSKINKGIFPFASNDNNLKHLTKKVHNTETLEATCSQSVYKKANIIVVSINCDLNKINGKYKINLVDFKRGIEQFAKKINEDTLIVVESTIPPGTCKKVVYNTIKKIFTKRKLNTKNIHVCHSYERVTPGKNYLNSITDNWRVYAGINKKSSDRCKNFLNKFINTKKYPLTRLQNTESSELSKLMENSFRAVNIAFVEEWSELSAKLNINLFDVIDGIKKRPTHKNLKDPGFGVGGYCLAKDPLMAMVGAKQLWGINQDFPFSKMAIQKNYSMPLTTIKRIKTFFNNNLRGVKVLLLGVSYKEDIADTRNSPSELFVRKMKSLGAKIELHDHIVKSWEETKLKIHKKIPALTNFDAAVFVVRHNEYQNINFKKWKSKKKNFLFFDANKVLSNKQIKVLKDLNKNIISIGRQR